MASVTVTLSVWVNQAGFRGGWSDNVSIGGTFDLTGVPQTLTDVRIYDDGRFEISIIGGNNRFTDDFAANGRFILEASDGETIEMVDGTGGDVTESYRWTPANSADLILFLGHIRGLTDQSVSFTLTDDPSEAAPHTPSAPTIAADSLTSVSITWPAPNDGGSPITSYNMQWKRADQFNYPSGNDLTNVTSPHILSGLVEDTPYNARIQAVNIIGSSAYGDEGTGRTQADLTPTIPDIPDMSGQVGVEVDVILDAGSGGDPPLQYFLTGLPAGLSFDRPSRRITGTPTTVEAPTLTYTVDDVNGDSATDTFVFTIIAADATPDLPTVPNRNAVLGTALEITLSPAVGGNPPLVYTAAPLPPGLTFNPSNRRISGTPTAHGSVTVTYTVTDTDGDTDTETFIFDIPDLMPQLEAIQGQSALIGSTVIDTLPEATSGDLPVVYTISGLPPGLTFDAATRTISGTPTDLGTSAVTYTVTDNDGDTDSITFAFVISAAAGALFLGAAAVAATYLGNALVKLYLGAEPLFATAVDIAPWEFFNTRSTDYAVEFTASGDTISRFEYWDSISGIGTFIRSHPADMFSDATQYRIGRLWHNNAGNNQFVHTNRRNGALWDGFFESLTEHASVYLISVNEEEWIQWDASDWTEPGDVISRPASRSSSFINWSTNDVVDTLISRDTGSIAAVDDWLDLLANKRIIFAISTQRTYVPTFP